MASAPLEVRVDASDIQRLYADLKTVPGNLTRELRNGIKKAADPLADAVKAEASWSSRIPGAVKVKPSFSARNPSVQIVVDPKKAPEAAPLNNGGRSGTFRHPTFGNRDRWVTQKAQPFFEVALSGHQHDADAAIEAVMDAVARKAGFR